MLRGHDKQRRLLKNAVLANRVAHAYLFSGPRAIGKRLVAMEFAAQLNCTQSQDGPCGECRDCNNIASGAHQNLFVVTPTDKDGKPDPDGLIRIGQAREVLAAVRLRIERGKKVVIIDGAHRLKVEAANALLKTLEEPPPDSVIVLVTEKPSELLQTILSRCQRLNFTPLDNGAVARHLVELGAVDRGAAGVMARLSEGSIGRALSYVDSDLLDERASVIRAFSSLRAGEFDLALKLADSLSKHADLIEMLEFLKIWVRDAAVASYGAGGLVVNSDLAPGMAANADVFSLYDAYRAIDAAITDILPPRYANKLLTLEALFLRLARLGPSKAA